MKLALATLLAAVSLALATTAESRPFTPGNLLVVHDDTLYEFTRAGALLQKVLIVHPRSSSPEATDVIVDRFGRAHIFNAASGDPTLSTWDPYSETWRHVAIAGGRSSLSLLGDTLITRSVTFDFLHGLVRRFYIPGDRIGDIGLGLDGRLYVVNDLSPNGDLRIIDPHSFKVIGQHRLRDPAGRYLTVLGLAAASDGKLYAGGEGGQIYEFAASGAWLRELQTTAGPFADMNLASDGTLVAGTFSGSVVVTTTSFSGFLRFSPPGSTRPSYAAFVPASIERPDIDADQVLDFVDTCPSRADPEQADSDRDGLGDLCDPFPALAANLPVCLDRLDADVQALAVLPAANAELSDQIDQLGVENAALRAEVEALAAAIDSDGDGVPNLRDLCWSPPRSKRIDGDGCTSKQRRQLQPKHRDDDSPESVETSR